MSSQSDTNQTTLTHKPVSRRNSRESGKVEKTRNRSNKTGRRNEIGQTAKTKQNASTELRAGIGKNASQKNLEGGLLIETKITEQNASSEPQQFTKRIGKNYYEVVVHFSNTSKENISDKITRLIRNEVANRTAVGQ